MFDYPHVLAEDMDGDIEHPMIGRYRGVTRSIKFERIPGPNPFAAPVFKEAGAEEDGASPPQEVREA